MMSSVNTVSEQALDYARSRMADGLSLSKSAVQLLEKMTAVALVPEGASEWRVADFEHGGMGRCDFSYVASLLSRLYRDASLVVELPLWRPDDPDCSASGFRVVVCRGEVYATCRLRDPISEIETTLRAADPSFMYNAVVLEHQTELGPDSCPTDLLQAERARLVAVLLGAYDGEGFVIVASRFPSPHSERDVATSVS